MFCERLLRHAAVVNLPDKNGYTPLHYALKSSLKMFELLLQYMGNTKLIDIHGDKMIVYAAASSKLEIFKVMIQENTAICESTKNRLTHVAYLNDNRDCLQSLCLAVDTSCALQYSIREEVVLHGDETKLKIPRKWVSQQVAIVERNGKEKNILQIRRFFDLEQARQFENCQILDEVTTVVARISEKIKQGDPQLRFTPVLSGSRSEGTKIGVLDELDFLCQLNFLSGLDITIYSSTDSPAFFQLQVNNDNPHVDLSLLMQFENTNLLSSRVLGMRFKIDICKALSDAKIWRKIFICR